MKNISANIETSVLRSDDSLERQNEKLTKMISSLMRRVETSGSGNDSAFAHFQTAATLEAQVRQRTLALEDALNQLNNSRARAEELRQAADQARRDLSDALEAIREGFALFDPQNKLVHANSRFARMFPDIVSSIQPGLHLENYLRRVANSAEIVFPDGMGREDWLEDRLTIHGQPNQHFLVELIGDRWVQVSEQTTANGATTIMQTEVTDMVRLERIEQRRLLDEQMELVRATLDHLNQGVLIIDKNRLIAGSNQKMRDHMLLPMEFFTSGYRVAAMIDEIAQKGIFRSTRDLFLLIDWMRNKHRAKTFHGELKRQDGRIYEVYAQTMPNDGFVISSTDVTNARQAARALEEAKTNLEQRVEERTEELRIARDLADEASQSKSRFLAATSHDLLQPINATKLFLQSLQTSDLNDIQTQIVGNISKAFSSVEAMLGGLLDISRLDAPTPVIHEPVSLAKLFETLRIEFAPIAAAKGLELRFRPCSCWVMSDASSLRRIAQNLISNAIKYTEQGGVLVGTRCRGETIIMEINDTGAGFAPEEIDTMYNEFQRFNRQNDGGGGMGLGLSIVQRSCALLGHHLDVMSEKGKGTKFRVHMQGTCSDNITIMEPQNTSPGQAPNLINMLILVIDNDEAILNATEILLEKWGATPVLARSYNEAKALLVELDIVADIALVDFQLDGNEDGLNVIEALRKDYPTMEALLITANRDQATLDRARQMDVPINHKPIDIKALENTLRSIKIN